MGGGGGGGGGQLTHDNICYGSLIPRILRDVTGNVTLSQFAIYILQGSKYNNTMA